MTENHTHMTTQFHSPSTNQPRNSPTSSPICWYQVDLDGGGREVNNDGWANDRWRTNGGWRANGGRVVNEDENTIWNLQLESDDEYLVSPPSSFDELKWETESFYQFPRSGWWWIRWYRFRLNCWRFKRACGQYLCCTNF